jgi:hypothetical protein
MQQSLAGKPADPHDLLRILTLLRDIERRLWELDRTRNV